MERGSSGGRSQSRWRERRQRKPLASSLHGATKPKKRRDIWRLNLLNTRNTWRGALRWSRSAGWSWRVSPRGVLGPILTHVAYGAVILFWNELLQIKLRGFVFLLSLFRSQQAQAMMCRGVFEQGFQLDVFFVHVCSRKLTTSRSKALSSMRRCSAPRFVAHVQSSREWRQAHRSSMASSSPCWASAILSVFMSFTSLRGLLLLGSCGCKRRTSREWRDDCATTLSMCAKLETPQVEKHG